LWVQPSVENSAMRSKSARIVDVDSVIDVFPPHTQ
jgi:hypothetical protein